MSHRRIVRAVQWVSGGMGWTSGEGKKKGKVSVRIIAAVRDHDKMDHQLSPLLLFSTIL
jgi:hypothetical protein